VKYCIECNEQLYDDAKFCSNCRAKQPKKIVEPKEEKLTKKTMPKKSTAKPAVKKSVAKKTTAAKKTAVKKTAPKPAVKKTVKKSASVKPEIDRVQVSHKRKCPSCGSTNIRIEKKGFRKGMLVLGIFGAIAEGIRSQQEQFVCKKCGHTWNDGLVW